MTKSNPKLQLQTLKEVAVCSQYASINARLNSKAQITEQDVAISDWDSIDTIGIYSGNSENGTKNAPVDHEWVTGIALRANGNSYFMNIIAIGQTNGQIYTRTMINNAWKDWETK